MTGAEAAERCGCGRTCVSVGTQFADVRVPVRLLPRVRIGEITTECCSEPAITVRQLPGVCRVCEILISQTVCLRIPVEYGAEAEAGQAAAVCSPPPCGGPPPIK